jgi:hypothetical protein
MRQRSWCSRRRGVAQWGGVGRATRSHWRAMRRPRPAERRVVLDLQRTDHGGAGCLGGLSACGRVPEGDRRLEKGWDIIGRGIPTSRAATPLVYPSRCTASGSHLSPSLWLPTRHGRLTGLLVARGARHGAHDAATARRMPGDGIRRASARGTLPTGGLRS